MAFRLLLLLKGAPAFDSDEADASVYVQKFLTGDLADVQFPMAFDGLRLWLPCCFYVLTQGWVYFEPLSTIFATGFISMIWVVWIDRKVSRVAALAAAVALAFPPLCAAYYGTHMEKRVETIGWGTLLIWFAGGWLEKPLYGFLFGLIVGWSFWCEPFILFFALPVLAWEVWERLKKRERRIPALLTALFGGVLGLVMGHRWNGPFDGMAAQYLHFGFADPDGIGRHLSLLWNVFSQYWNGNFPFGYLQNSDFGREVDPYLGGGWPFFFSCWTFGTFAFALWGFSRLVQKDWKTASLVLCPALEYLLFFIFSNQVWDATSFRYLAYGPLFETMGFALGIHFVFRRNAKAAIVLLVLWAMVQGFLGAQKYETLNERPLAQMIADDFQKTGLRMGYADHWVSEAADYFSNGQICLVSDKIPFSGRSCEAVHQASKIGVVFVKGLDRPAETQAFLTGLQKNGYILTRNWPMLHQWTILELEKKSGPRKPS